MTKKEILEAELRIIDNEIEKHKFAISILENGKKMVVDKVNSMTAVELRREMKALDEWNKKLAV